MSDLLSASSLLLAILTTLFGIFYSSIIGILELKPNTHPIDDTSNYNKALSVRKTKIYPLLFSTIGLTLIFIPDSWHILKESIIMIWDNGFKAVSYNAIKTTYIAVTIFMIALTINVIATTLNFNSHLKKINPKRRIQT